MVKATKSSVFLFVLLCSERQKQDPRFLFYCPIAHTTFNRILIHYFYYFICTVHMLLFVDQFQFLDKDFSKNLFNDINIISRDWDQKVIIEFCLQNPCTIETQLLKQEHLLSASGLIDCKFALPTVLVIFSKRYTLDITI